MQTCVRDAAAADHPAILALNRDAEALTSPLDAGALSRLAAQAACLRVAVEDGAVLAFLLALREGADYASPNYRWFAARYPRFLYIDRIVVAAGQRQRGLGALLYRDLFAFARGQGVATLACEYDRQPPNEASRRFHARFGFGEAGTQWLPQRRKQVSLQVATVDS